MYKIDKYDNGAVAIVKSKEFDLYAYTTYVGKQQVYVEQGDSIWLVNDSKAEVVRGGKFVNVEALGVVIRGYQCEEKTSSYSSGSNLPYVNGCSSHQVFPPVRIGDPTMQLLYLPSNTSEQAHHIHSTARVVYVLDGEGWSVQGMNNETEVKLNKGDVIILDKMTPHHFRTESSSLTVVPIHIFSSTVFEKNHPMFNGTFEI